MSELVYHILNENYVKASNVFEDRLNSILEQKLVEMKKCIQAEGVGGLTAAQIQARKELGWKKAADVLGDPRDEPLPSITPKHKPPVKKRKKLKEDISRSDVEAEKEKLKKSPGFKQIQSRRKASPSPEHMPAVDQKPEREAPRLKEPRQEPAKSSASDTILDRESKMKEMQRHGTEAQKRGAGRWLRKTKGSRISAGVGKHFGPAVNKIVSGLAGLNTME